MEIIQKIETKDIIALNHYLIDKNISYKISKLILGILSLITGIASIVYELITIQKVLTSTIIISTLLIILGIIILFFAHSILKFFITKRVIKRNEKIDDIKVTLSEAGFTWEYAHKPSEKEVLPYTWNSIIKVTEKENHLFFHVNAYVILFIKKEACENTKEIVDFVKTKLGTRYKNK